MFAALTPDRKSITLAVVNATAEPQKFELNVTGGRLAGQSTVWQLAGKSLDAVNKVGEQPQVGVKEMPIDRVSQSVSVAPISVNIYAFPLQ